MRTPRCYIVTDGDIAHIVWRCNNRQSLLGPAKIKDKVLELYFKYAGRYDIGIIDFDILDNHAHFILKISSAKNLGDFTRVTHSQISQHINKHFQRDSQAIKDRYKSPVVRSYKYLLILLAYVWLNRFKADRSQRPENNQYCSVYHRLQQTAYGQHLMSYADLGLCDKGEELSFLKAHLKHSINMLFENLNQISKNIFQNSVVVDTADKVKDRYKIIRQAMLGKRSTA